MLFFAFANARKWNSRFGINSSNEAKFSAFLEINYFFCVAMTISEELMLLDTNIRSGDTIAK